jgi:hypothetical protein
MPWYTTVNRLGSKMLKYFYSLFSTNFMPHGYCLGWHSDVIWLHVISDALITLAYLCPRWTSENRPSADTSKPANGAEPEQQYLYPAGDRAGKQFSHTRLILISPGRRIRQRWEATGAPTQRPEWWGRFLPPRALMFGQASAMFTRNAFLVSGSHPRAR